MEEKENLSIHRPALLKEVIALLDIRKGDTVIDGTLGGGGHAEEIIRKVGKTGKLLGIDRDREALERTRKRLSKWKEQCYLEYGNFSEMEEIAKLVNIVQADQILLDLGMSSDQLENSERGFSFMKKGPLDMRMDLEQKFSAKEWIATTPVIEMARVFRMYGEEPAAMYVARRIEEERKKGVLIDTTRLAEIITWAKGEWRGKVHPATRIFQAIRIKVNDELVHLEKGLMAALRLLKNKGRLGVITFHSLEDRLVKHFFRSHEVRTESLYQGGVREIVEYPVVVRVNKKPIVAGKKEIFENPRVRSAKLRVVEKREENIYAKTTCKK